MNTISGARPRRTAAQIDHLMALWFRANPGASPVVKTIAADTGVCERTVQKWLKAKREAAECRK